MNATYNATRGSQSLPSNFLSGDPRVSTITARVTGNFVGTTDEIRALIKSLHLPATLYPIEGGDHSLKVPKKGNPPQAQVHETTMDELARWLSLQ